MEAVHDRSTSVPIVARRRSACSALNEAIGFLRFAPRLPFSVVVQFGKRLVSGHRFSDAAKRNNSERPLDGESGVGNGNRTRNRRSHSPVLCQLSYSHRQRDYSNCPTRVERTLCPLPLLLLLPLLRYCEAAKDASPRGVVETSLLAIQKAGGGASHSTPKATAQTSNGQPRTTVASKFPRSDSATRL
jgi:hypothetical protein